MGNELGKSVDHDGVAMTTMTSIHHASIKEVQQKLTVNE